MTKQTLKDTKHMLRSVIKKKIVEKNKGETIIKPSDFVFPSCQ